jgi:hypothetical protein
VVEITLRGNAANVLLMDSSNFSTFSRDGSYGRAYGGLAQQSPVHLTIPAGGHWYVVLHMDGLRGQTNASVRVLPKHLPPIRQAAPVSYEPPSTRTDPPRMRVSYSSPLGSIREAADAYTEAAPPVPAAQKAYDVFISHAGEDKDAVVRPLAHALVDQGLAVWYDEFELRIGDSLRRKIDSGLARCRFGVVVLSHAFFGKGWPNYELDGLVTREVAGGGQLILPVWHGVTQADVMEYSPTLAGKLARSTSDTDINSIASEIAEVARAR